MDVSKRNQKWLRDHRRKPASPGVPRKTEEDQSRRARYGNFSKAPKNWQRPRKRTMLHCIDSLPPYQFARG